MKFEKGNLGGVSFVYFSASSNITHYDIKPFVGLIITLHKKLVTEKLDICANKLKRKTFTDANLNIMRKKNSY